VCHGEQVDAIRDLRCDLLLFLRSRQRTASAKSAGTDLRVNLHSLRHTLNTRMAQAGVLKEIREFVLGHKRRDGNDIYTHLCAREYFQIDGRRSSVQ
jgi:integrase